jgi:phospho-N-acetylmuramoyl-pentapeptide-transferase
VNTCLAVLIRRARSAVPQHRRFTPASTELSYVREIAALTLSPVVFVLFCIIVVSAWSNAVNLTDGLDGSAAGAMAMVTAAYVLITFWQFRNA